MRGVIFEICFGHFIVFFWEGPELKKVQEFFSDQTPIALPCCHQHDDRFHAKKIHFVSYARYSLGTFQVTNLVHTYKIYLICGGLGSMENTNKPSYNFLKTSKSRG